jgi:hypothetical protein
MSLATTSHCNNDDFGCGGRLNKSSEIFAESAGKPFPVAARFLAEGRSPMFSEEDRGRPDWEMSRSIQRRFSIGAAIVFAVVVLLNLVGQPPSMWAEKPAETVLASK